MPKKRTDQQTAAPIRVTVKVFGGLRHQLGAPSIELDLRPFATLGALFAELRASRPDLAEKLDAGLQDGYLNALINGRNIRFLDGSNTQLKDGDSIAFLPPIGGG